MVTSACSARQAASFVRGLALDVRWVSLDGCRAGRDRRRPLVHGNRGIESACRAGHPTWLRCSSLKYWRYDLGRRAVLARRVATLSASPYVRRPVLRRPRLDVRSSETGAWAQLRPDRNIRNCRGSRLSLRICGTARSGGEHHLLSYWQRLTSAGAPGSSTPSSGSFRGLCGNWIRPVREHDQS